MQEKIDRINNTSLPAEALRKAVSAAIEDPEIGSRLQCLCGQTKLQIALAGGGFTLYYAGTKVITLLESDPTVAKEVRDYLRRVRTMQGMLAMPYPDRYKEDFREYEELRRKLQNVLEAALAA